MSIHDIVEPLDPSAIRQGRQVRLAPGECAVVFSPLEHGMIAQSVVVHPDASKLGSDAREIAMVLTYAANQFDIRARLHRKLEECRKDRE